MKLLLFGLFVFNGFLALTVIEPLKAQTLTAAENQAEVKLFYTYYNTKIPLALRENIFAPQSLTSFPKKQEHLGQKTYIETTLPVLSSQYETEKPIILPNEIIVSFDEKLSQGRKKSILQKHNLKVIRKLRFSANRYLVKSTSVSGTAILNIANQLDMINGVKYATPNFLLYRKSNSYEKKENDHK